VLACADLEKALPGQAGRTLYLDSRLYPQATTLSWSPGSPTAQHARILSRRDRKAEPGFAASQRLAARRGQQVDANPCEVGRRCPANGRAGHAYRSMSGTSARELSGTNRWPIFRRENQEA
jgi:hypothetical protein